ncbi:uncharacterized protein LOC131570082 isoform X2 [Ammospiza caudacuta]|uniref:uncharacterized protein LOC131570082 isoform X2 n=1 Tax=Ammospiza caudacuta TaxID=2857398 RepID=UPI00273A0E12|nr:uncharacterized protein LOC131570082 isoform X2 [Ammospiza caudacuta]
MMFSLPLMKLMPTPIGMNLTLVRQLLLHQDLIDILKKIKESGQKTLVTVHHNVRQIHRVMERGYATDVQRVSKTL